MIERTLYTPEHIAFRDSYQRFADKEIAPHHAAWEEQGYVDRAVWEKAGANGFLTKPASSTELLATVNQFVKNTA